MPTQDAVGLAENTQALYEDADIQGLVDEWRAGLLAGEQVRPAIMGLGFSECCPLPRTLQSHRVPPSRPCQEVLSTPTPKH